MQTPTSPKPKYIERNGSHHHLVPIICGVLRRVHTSCVCMCVYVWEKNTQAELIESTHSILITQIYLPVQIVSRKKEPLFQHKTHMLHKISQERDKK